MAKSRKKATDGPKIAMRVTRNGLEPLSPYDAEMLASWRVGAVVNVELTLASLRPLERRYRAMLGKLFKTHDVPWPNEEAAHIFLKETGGFVEPYKRDDGVWTHKVQSLSELTDKELDRFFEHFCVVLHKMGVDPETLRKESPDTGRDEMPSAERSVAHTEADKSPTPSTSEELAPVGMEHDGTAGETAQNPGSTQPVPDHGTTPAADQEGEAVVADDRPQSEATTAEPDEAIDREWLRTATRMLVGASQGGFDLEVLSNQAKALNQHHTPAAVSKAAKEKGNAIYKHLAKRMKAHEAPDFEVLEKLSGMRKAEMTNAK